MVVVGCSDPIIPSPRTPPSRPHNNELLNLWLLVPRKTAKMNFLGAGMTRKALQKLTVVFPSCAFLPPSVLSCCLHVLLSWGFAVPVRDGAVQPGLFLLRVQRITAKQSELSSRQQQQ
eukprot:5800521-Amphidinium_carterae.1